MKITAAQLRKIGLVDNKNTRRITKQLAECLPDKLPNYQLDKPHRLAQFLAQIAHESAHFQTTTEYASGAAYEGRKDLGNTQKGDGKRYKGRGLIQITGRFNYHKYGGAVRADLINNPKMAAAFPMAIETAFFYWAKNGLNDYADKGDLLNITRIINGGYNGIDDRFKKYGQAALVLLKNWKSIKAFQSDLGLIPDGIVGPNTVAILHNELLKLKTE